MNRSVLFALTVLLCLATFASAQIKPGDVVVCDKRPIGDVLYVDRSSGQITTLVAGPVSTVRAVLGLTMAADNTSMYLIEEGGPFTFWSISANGSVATIGAVSASGEGAPTSCDLLQDGQLVVSSAVYQQRDYLRVYNPTTNTYTSLFTSNPSTLYYYTVRQNPDDGDLLICSAFGNDLLEYEYATASLRTIVSGIGRNNSVDVDPATGNFVCGGGAGIFVISPQGTILRTISATNARRVRVEPSTGRIITLTGTSSGAVNQVVEYDQLGTALKTHGPYTGYNFTGLDIYGWRRVTGSGPATPGTTYNVDFAFLTLPNVTYVAALSLASRPGFSIGGQTMNLAVDGLFLLSVQGLFVTGFQGQLDAFGRASGSIQIPSFVPQGLTIYCSALATTGSYLEAGNTIGITVR